MTLRSTVLLRAILPGVLLAAPPLARGGDEFTPGNLLICTENVIYEYTRAGALVQSFEVPTGPWDATARDLVVDREGRVRLYNGTFEPFLSTLDPTGPSWRHETFPGWSTVNNGTYGGIATRGVYTFATDMHTARAEEQGIVRFEEGGSPRRFAEDIEPIDLTIGLDGLLYALHPGGSPGGLQIDVYEPDTLSFVRQMFDPWQYYAQRSVAVDAGGNLYLVEWAGKLRRVGPDGSLQEMLDLHAVAGMRDLYDVDVAADGTLVVSNRFGRVLVTDTAFSSLEFFEFGDSGIFVHIIPGVCSADCDGSGALDLFDFLCFQGLFAAGAAAADCDGSGTIDFFDFLCFQNVFSTGC